MIELPDDFRDLLIELHEAGADFVVVGGHAVAFHGHPRATKDMDVLVRADPVHRTWRTSLRSRPSPGAPRRDAAESARQGRRLGAAAPRARTRGSCRPHRRTHRGSLPIRHWTLRAPKPRNSAYPAQLTTLGDHIKARRLDLGLRQRDVAAQVGVTTSTVTNWEKNRTSPDLRVRPKVIAFLGYDPERRAAGDAGEALVAYRRSRGMSQAEQVAAPGINPWTLGRTSDGR